MKSGSFEFDDGVRVSEKREDDVEEEKRRNRPYTLGGAAEELTRRLGYEVSHRMVWNYVHAGEIKELPRVTSRSWHRISAAELERFIEARTGKT